MKLKVMLVVLSLLAASSTFAQQVSIPEKYLDPKGCVMKRTNDGLKRGFLWKPIAEHFPGPVVLLPEKYAGFKITKVVIINLSGKVVETLRMKGSGICEPGKECLFRPAFQGYGMLSSALRRKFKSVIVRVIPKNGECFSYLIKNPTKRYD